MFSATILRPLTSAKAYATIAGRKSKIRRGEEHNTEKQKAWKGKESESAEGKRKRRGKAAADPERVSGDGSAPRRAFRPANEFHVFVAFVQ